jgi:EAL domain-containing protein (putative c-di-GMP-specific phosphodiesterase class I)
VQRLKIDGTFSGTVADSPLARTAVSGWVQLAHQLGLVAVAQGVETQAAWRCLVDLGCDEVQGYGIGCPMPAAQLAEWLSQPSPAACPPFPGALP